MTSTDTVSIAPNLLLSFTSYMKNEYYIVSISIYTVNERKSWKLFITQTIYAHSYLVALGCSLKLNQTYTNHATMGASTKLV